jgi:hypothetical protein
MNRMSILVLTVLLTACSRPATHGDAGRVVGANSAEPDPSRLAEFLRTNSDYRLLELDDIGSWKNLHVQSNWTVAANCRLEGDASRLAGSGRHDHRWEPRSAMRFVRPGAASEGSRSDQAAGS